jgi:hypothetical protein
MIHRSEGFCALALIGGGFEGAAEHIRLFVGEDGYWYLSAQSRQRAMYAEAIAVRVVKTSAADGTSVSLQTPVASPWPLPLPSGEIDADEWVDLMKWIDVARDRTRGEWTRQGDELIAAQQVQAGTELVLPVTLGRGYDLEVEFALQEGTTLVVVLPADEHTFNVNIGTERHGIEKVAGQVVGHPRLLTAGQPYKAGYSVRTEGDETQVVVTLDGEPLLSWSGPEDSLSGWPLHAPRRPKVGFWTGTGTISGIRVRDPAGETTWIERSPID